jgi:hypothetical protein
LRICSRSARASNIQLFDYVVAENRALVYDSKGRDEIAFGKPPPERFVRHLHRRVIRPLETGKVIVATWQPYGTAVLEVIQELGLDDAELGRRP